EPRLRTAQPRHRVLRIREHLLGDGKYLREAVETIARRWIQRAAGGARAAQRGLADAQQLFELAIRACGVLLDLVAGFELEPGQDPLVRAADLADRGSAAEQRLEAMLVCSFAPAHLI